MSLIFALLALTPYLLGRDGIESGAGFSHGLRGAKTTWVFFVRSAEVLVPGGNVVTAGGCIHCTLAMPWPLNIPRTVWGAHLGSLWTGSVCSVYIRTCSTPYSPGSILHVCTYSALTLTLAHACPKRYHKEASLPLTLSVNKREVTPGRCGSEERVPHHHMIARGDTMTFLKSRAQGRTEPISQKKGGARVFRGRTDKSWRCRPTVV